MGLMKRHVAVEDTRISVPLRAHSAATAICYSTSMIKHRITCGPMTENITMLCHRNVQHFICSHFLLIPNCSQQHS